MRVCLLLTTVSLLCLLTSCSGQQMYGAGQAWQRNQCFKISDAQERSRCLETANASYEQYQRKTEDSQ